VIEEYPYEGINFLRDPNMPMPLGEEGEEIGKHTLKLFNFLNFKILSFYGNFKVLTQCFVIYRCGIDATE
jgi:hypothetical protein